MSETTDRRAELNDLATERRSLYPVSHASYMCADGDVAGAVLTYVLKSIPEKEWERAVEMAREDIEHLRARKARAATR